MTSSTALRGVFPVIQTPYGDDGSIDERTLGDEIDWLFRHGVHGLTIALVSEILRLTAGERNRLARRTIELARDRGPVVVSVGGESTVQAREFARAATAAGAGAVMAIPPLSVRCGETELRGYFEGILDATSLPLVIQDASGYLGRPLSMEFQVDLFRRHPGRILFKPEAEPAGPVISGLREVTAGQAPVFEGSGGLDLLENHRRGCTGTMPGSDLPWAISRLWQALESAEAVRARSIQSVLTDLVAPASGSLDAYIACEKHLLVRQGVFRNTRVRGPVGEALDGETLERIDSHFDSLVTACNLDPAEL